ncbi:MAG: chromosome segregation protein SMC, partial [Zetaproteobacteria bacterium]
QQQLHAAEREERAQRARAQASGKRREEVALRLAAQRARLKDLEAEISLRCRLAPDELVRRVPETQEQDDTLAARCRTLEERLERFGPVNLLAIEEHEQAEARASFLAEQVADLERSLNTLNETIERIDRTMRQRFRAVFEQTNEIFQRTFPRLFGGGRAELRLDSDDVLRAGVEVIAQPPGKRLQDVGLLSGGEKALTAVALVFSIFQIKPAPFCVLDEVDAPLDDANVDRFGRMLRELSDRVQFLAISHNKITMQHADRLIGVSMPEPGVSRIIGVELET